MNKLTKLISFIILIVISNLVLAEGGGLEKGTNALSTIKTWAYSFVGVMALCYILYNVCMALLERKSWGDVGMSIAYASIAGGCILAGEFALNIFK